MGKKEKKELEKLEAKEIERNETQLLTGEEQEPSSVEDFEKSVLASPNSSLVWIKYMAFYLEKKPPNYESAKGIAKRALDKINFREENERLNVHIALFNMTLEYSLDEADGDNILKEMLKTNDQYKVYSQVASIYSQRENHEKAEEMYKMMVRKFGQEIETWNKLGLHYFKEKNLKEARFTLQRAIQILKEKRDHVTVTSQFAQMEFKYGETERGKTIFETILGNFPRRIDM